MKKFTVKITSLITILSLVIICICGTVQAVPSPDTSVIAEESSQHESDAFTYNIKEDGTVALTKYCGHEENLIIPEKINGMPVSSIGEGCFAGNIRLKKVHVPEGIASIEDYAFECCSVLEKIYLPESLENIGNGVFSGCCSLYLLDIQDNVKNIGNGAFLECTKLVSFIAPKALENIGAFAFANCSNLVIADMSGSSLSAVSDRMFYNCRELKTVKLPEGIQAIGKRAFSGNKALMYIYLPDSVNSVASFAFESCENLQNFSVTTDEIAPYTFTGCSSLAYVILPKTLKSIGECAFNNTPVNISELEIPAGAIIDENAFGFPAENETNDCFVETDKNSFDGPDSEEKAEPSVPADITVEEITKAAAELGYISISNEEFPEWSEKYLAFNSENALLDMELNPYISKYKGEIGYYYQAMTAVASGVSSEIESARINFGDDFEDMYRMINHGLKTEISRFRMENDMLLYTGVYDFQLCAITGTDEKPTLDELKACIGKTFTDKCLTSTSTEAQVAFGFSDTLFVIYASAENLNALGAVSIDSYMHTCENEILLNSGAEYRILGAGVLEGTISGPDGELTTDTREYVLLQLIN